MLRVPAIGGIALGGPIIRGVVEYCPVGPGDEVASCQVLFLGDISIIGVVAVIGWEIDLGIIVAVRPGT